MVRSGKAQAEKIQELWGLAKKGLQMSDADLYAAVFELTGSNSISKLEPDQLARVVEYLEGRLAGEKPAGEATETTPVPQVKLPVRLRIVLHDYETGVVVGEIAAGGKLVNPTFVAYAGSAEIPDESGLRLKFDLTMAVRAIDS